MQILHLQQLISLLSYSAALATKKFSLAETVYAFKSLDLSWAGFVVNLRPALYILVNVDEQ